ncbi:hypothetical protein [Sphingomonas sp. M1-B02]|uniref:hypothetical protein n=1 Tax=Sphingomonas sp. M1-B02 TaxID=3114300 RepID=UPI0022403C3B|nr:hypothetical protein [Sphingomonas sp. S6-11]UZK66727.1 hypothetical protein OKW87_02490 [Sphingomonas sp. S6-11]
MTELFLFKKPVIRYRGVMIRISALAFYCAMSLTAPSFAAAKPAQNQAPAAVGLPSYAVVAPQVIGAPLIVDARIRSAVRIKGAEAADVAPDRARFYIEADVLALIRGATAVPPRIGYVADVPLGERGRAPKLKKQRVLLFARPVASRPDQVQLTGLDSQRIHSPELDMLVRGVTREVLAAEAPPAITRVGNAFHVPGTLPGEGETQIFLQTENNQPVSLQILRRPGEQPRWSVSLGDIVDDSARPPLPDTLLWYRLACGLPSELPAGSIESDEGTNAAIAREDYAFVLRALGPCV